MNNTYSVSVICNTYNHQKYIEKCINGIVNQKTSFKFKLIIHDDASTDSTPEIILKYQLMYPDIIFPILEKENMYSKGVKITKDIVLPLIETPYVAICEGDDYWCDDQKLETQYTYMNHHPNCGICVHDAIRINYFSHIQDLNSKEIFDADYSVEDVIRFKSGKFATNSIFIRTNLLKNIPEEFSCKRFGDWQMIIYGAQNKHLHYIPRVMSVYNQGVPGSYTEKSVDNLKYNLETRYEILNLLDRLNVYYDYNYSSTLKKIAEETRKKIIYLKFKIFIKNHFKFLVILKRKLSK